MCFHNSMNKKLQALSKRYNRNLNAVEIAEKIISEQYHINAFSNPSCPVITDDESIQIKEWGLIPFWVKDRKNADEIRRKTYNARSETLFDKPSYRTPIKSQRCIIPSTGYFEWHHNGKETTPYFIFLKDEPIFSIGGIYDYWTDPETGKEYTTFSMITTEANELTGYIHNGGSNPHRMPFILSKEEEKLWLNPNLTKEEIKSLLQPFPEEPMDAYVIGNDFIKKNPHDKSIIEPIEERIE